MPDLANPFPARALVTGATGLLGGHVVAGLLAAGSSVTALVRDAEKARRLLPASPELEVVTGDVTDSDSYRRHLRGVDAVFHTAAYYREYYEPGRDLAVLERTNVQAVEDLLYASAKADVPVVVHTSSMAVLGPGSVRSPADEETPPGALHRSNAYFASKIRAEATVARCVAVTGQRVPMILPGWMWGPGDAAPTNAGRQFLQVASGTMRAAPNAGHHLVDARDVADACLRAAVSGASCRRYLVAGRWYPLPQVYAEIAAAAGVTTPRTVSARLLLSLVGLLDLGTRALGRPGLNDVDGLRALVEGSRSRLSSARAERELGARFRPLVQTIHDEAAWYRDRGMLGAARTPTMTG